MKRPKQAPVSAVPAQADDGKDTLLSDHVRGCQGREYICTCGYDDERDAEIDRLRALVASLNREELPVSVKALEWVQRVFNMQNAETIIGWYSVEYRQDAEGVRTWYWKRSGENLKPAADEVAAKAAAQADYEKRIHSALASPPPPAQADDGKDAEIGYLKIEMEGVENAKEEIGRLLGLTEEFRWKRISAAIHEQKRLIRELVSVLNRTHRHVAGRNPPLCDEMFAALQKARAIGIEP